MIRFEDAQAIIERHATKLPVADVPLADALGLVLARDVTSDVDMPPFDKSAMDGFAVRGADVADVPVTLRIVEEVPAGVMPTVRVGPGQCSRIMTGAPLPDGADAVVRFEDTASDDGSDQVVIRKGVPIGKNVCFKSEDVRKGQVVLSAGHVIRAAESAVLAACGAARVPVVRRPRVAVLSTGDEIVPIDVVPRPGQIRDSNAHYIRARVQDVLGIEATALGIAPDDRTAMRDLLERGLAADVLLTSGAVSTGAYDLLPRVMQEAGITFHFESVAMQPGRPIVFGKRGAATVFGLPGNPVAVLVATELFVLPTLRRLMGYATEALHAPVVDATLEAPVKHRPGRRSHKPGVLRWEAGGYRVTPVEYHGSAHIAALSRANALIVQPTDQPVQEAGAQVTVVRLG